MHATMVSDFPVPAPPVNAVMHDSSNTCRTANACEGFNAWHWTRCFRMSWSSFHRGGASLGSARMFASSLGLANPCWISLRNVRKAPLSGTTLHQ